MRWEGPQQQDRLREQEQCEWWLGCTLPPLAAESLGGVESGRSWLGPGRLEFHRQGSRRKEFHRRGSGKQGFGRQQEPGRKPCYVSERVLELALGQFGRVLPQSGTGLKQKKFQEFYKSSS